MIKYFCDACNCEIHERQYKLELPVHVTSKNPAQCGYVQMDKGIMQPVSGITKSYMLCLTCYNKLMYPLFENFKKIQSENCN